MANADASSPTECNRCGDCCERIELAWSLPEALAEWAKGDGGSPNAAFLAAHWQEVERRPDGTSIAACDQFDRASRLCRSHASRPPVCSGFPWYGDSPALGRKVLPERCEFWADLPAAERPTSWRPLNLTTKPV